MKALFPFLAVITLVANSCKEDHECPTLENPQPYEQEIFEFQAVDAGGNTGYCGPILVTTVDSNSVDFVYYKAVNLPPEISFSLDIKYKGVFEILPEKYKCMDNRPDPKPGDPAPTIYPHFVNILEWEVK